MIRTPRHARLGLTLIELMVGVAIGGVVVAAAFTFMVHQNYLFEFTHREIDRDRSGRVALDILGQDLRHAGLGVGYQADGTFNGLRLGKFTVPGGASFSSDDRAITLTSRSAGADQTYEFITDDIGMRFANGSYRSVVQYGVGFGQVCRGGEFAADDVVLLQTEDAFESRTVRLLSVASADACLSGRCEGGCDDFTFAIDESFLATPTSASAEYQGGEMFGNYREVIWYVENGDLHRAEVSSNAPCADRSCGGVVAGNVETLQMRVWQWDPDAGAWEDRTDLGSLIDRRRIRVDLELVVRMEGAKAFATPSVDLLLEADRCLPGCGQRDEVSRRALRVSVEVRNSGRMTIGGQS